MREVDYDPNLYPYGITTIGETFRLTFLPELRVVHSEPTPARVLTILADQYNADYRAGQEPAHIEKDTTSRVNVMNALYEAGALS